MRSTFTGLNTMVKGIFANQLSLDTVGHNITNASTEGYSRQSVNLAASMCQMQPTINGDQAVGTGVDSLSIVRARNIYADKQYRTEVATQNYNSIMQTNYEKIETTFYDSEGVGIQNAMHEFWQSLQDLSTNASDNDARNAVVGKGTLMVDYIHTAKDEMVTQIEMLNDELKAKVDDINRLTDEIVNLNKKIVAMEANGSSANDLRDQRDLACDKLAEYLSITVTEQTNGYYSVVADGVTLVNKATKLSLEAVRGYNQGEFINDVNYGTANYGVRVAETKTAFYPKNGSLRGVIDAIDENKQMITHLAEISAFMLTTFNAQHRAGYDMNGMEGENFFGSPELTYTSFDYSEFKYDYTDNDPAYTYIYAGDRKLTGVDIIEALMVNTKISGSGGTQYIAAKTNLNETGSDAASTRLGDNAVLLSNFFDMHRGYTELTSEPIRDLYYSYYDKKGDTINIFYDKITTTTDNNGTELIDEDDTTTTRELVFRDNYGSVYKVTKSYSGNDDVTYEDSRGIELTLSTTEGDEGEEIIVFSGNQIVTTMNVDGTYTTAAKAVSYTAGKFLVYSGNDGQIYKSINADGEVSYTDEKDNAITKIVVNPDDLAEDAEIDETLIATYRNEETGKTYTVHSNGISIRAAGDISIYSYYNHSVSQLGLRSETMDLKVESQDELIVQIQNWRSSTAGVDWNEELTNMIKFQKGYGACARCLTAMDEILDRLVNNTGQVGR